MNAGIACHGMRTIDLKIFIAVMFNLRFDGRIGLELIYHIVHLLLADDWRKMLMPYLFR